MAGPSPPSALLRRVLVSVLLAALAVGVGAGAFRYLRSLKRPPTRAGGRPPLPLVRAERVTVKDHPEMLRGYGVARALREARVTAEIAGVVRWIAPDLRPGGTVAPPPRGQDGVAPPPPSQGALIGLDRRDLEDALERLRRQGAQSEADAARIRTSIRNLDVQMEVLDEQLETARAELRRIESLVPRTATPSEADRQRLSVLALRLTRTQLVSQREDAHRQLDVIAAILETLEVEIRKAQRDLERTYVHAPFAGRVAARHVEVGMQVAPGAPLFDVVDTSVVEVAIALPARCHADVGPGSPVTLRRAEDEAAGLEATVTRVAPVVDLESRTFLAYVEISNAGATEAIPPGAHLVADVRGRVYSGALVVPRVAFVGDRVYVVERGEEDEPSVARERVPRVRHLLFDRALVEPGQGAPDLVDGDEVIVTNLEDVAEGSRIRVTEPASR